LFKEVSHDPIPQIDFRPVDGLVASAALADATLLNASYDVARDVYKDFNPMFQKYWKAENRRSVELKQSHGGSTKQVRAVADGLEADVVTMNQSNDIEFLADKGLVAKDWAKKFPNNASPYTSTMVFIVARATRRRSRTGPMSPRRACR
jgi:sulfate transport system substrate-binding protein